MHRMITSVAVIGVLLTSLTVQAMGADQRAPITKEHNVASPPANTTAPAPPKTNGFVIQGNQLRALPGYVLNRVPTTK